jgi:hypothetical protein
MAKRKSRRLRKRIEKKEARENAEAVAEAQRVSKATQRAEVVLARLFDWVGKTDGRTAFLFAVNTALGGVALGALALSNWSAFEVAAFGVYFAFFSIVSYNLILVQYPNVSSPNKSMLFFGTIASHSFDEFVSRFSSMKDDDYLRDVLYQCHVNSAIVQKKFQRLQRAMFLLILSSVVWVPIVAVPALRTPGAQSFINELFLPRGEAAR